MIHNANHPVPSFYNYFYDYAVSNVKIFSELDYSLFPTRCKKHTNANFTLLGLSYPKLDLIAEQREKNALYSDPVLLIFSSQENDACRRQKISDDKFCEIWSDIAFRFLRWRPNGLVVFRSWPMNYINRKLEAKFAKHDRIIIDQDYDNKFWMARANFFVTDYSRSFINFSMTAKRPSIRMFYTLEEKAPQRDEWGWTISRSSQIIPILEEIERDEAVWTEALRAKQKREMPTLGKSFAILAEMINRIFNNNDDPAWPKIDKGNTPLDTRRDLLKLVAKMTRNGPFVLADIAYWVDYVLKSSPDIQCEQIWLLLLKRAILTDYESVASNAELMGLSFEGTHLRGLALTVDAWLSNAIIRLPFVQVTGLLRHLLRQYPQKSAAVLLITITSKALSGNQKKRMLFFLLMEWQKYDYNVLSKVNELQNEQPQHFSRHILILMNRYLPLAMRIPLPLRRYAAMILGLRKKLARKYWLAHRALK